MVAAPMPAWIWGGAKQAAAPAMISIRVTVVPHVFYISKGYGVDARIDD